MSVSVNTTRIADCVRALHFDQILMLAELLRDAVAEKRMWEQAALERGDQMDAQHARAQADVAEALFDAVMRSPTLDVIAS